MEVILTVSFTKRERNAKTLLQLNSEREQAYVDSKNNHQKCINRSLEYCKNANRRQLQIYNGEYLEANLLQEG